MIALQSAYAQSGAFRHVSVEDGLPSSTVWWTIQDRQGFMWFGTEAGAVRYDGKHFRHFGKEEGIADNEVMYLFEDQGGRVWFLPFLGKLSYLENDSIHTFPDSLRLGEIVTYMMVEDAEKGLWISTSDGIAHFPDGDAAQGRWIRDLGPTTARIHRFKAFNFYQDGAGRLLCLTDRGVLTLRPEKKLIPFHSQQGLADPRGILLRNQVFLYADVDGIVAYESGRHEMVLPYADLVRRLGQQPTVNRFFQDSDGIIWIGTSAGLLRFSDPSLDLRDMQYDLQGMEVTCINEDDERNIWVTTSGDGVHFLTRNAVHVRNLNTRSGLAHNKVTAVAYHAGQTWVGHKNGDFTRLRSDTPVQTYTNNASGLSRKIRGMAAMPTGRLWAASDVGLYRFEPPAYDRLLRIDMRVNKNVAAGREGNLLLANAGFTLNIPADSVDSFIDFFESAPEAPLLREKRRRFRPYALSFERAYAVHEDRQGRTWWGSTKTLYVRGKGLDTSYAYGVNAITSDAQGRLFVSTTSNGLVIHSGDHIYQFGEASRLGTNAVHTVLIQNDSTAWIGSKNGLAKMVFRKRDSLEARFEIYGRADGLAGDEITSLALRADTLLVGTMNGLSIFPIPRMLRDVRPARVYITSLKIWDRPVQIQPEMELAPDENDITIRFTGISFKHSGPIRFKYRLSGLDEAWRFTDESIVRYPPLAPGAYRFEVYSIKENGIASTAPAQFEFRIRAAWYTTWWFLVLCIVGFGALAGWLIYGRIRRIQSNARLRQQLLETEQSALLARMNPQFVAHALKSAQALVAAGQHTEAETYLSHLSLLIQKGLENAEQQEITLEEETAYLEQYLALERMGFKGRLAYIVDVNEKLNVKNLLLPPMLIHPFVENAALHAFTGMKGEGRIEVRITLDGDYLKVRIKDNGIGTEERIRRAGDVPPEMAPYHADNLPRRIALLNRHNKRRIEVEVSNPGAIGTRSGTIVNMRIPVANRPS